MREAILPVAESHCLPTPEVPRPAVDISITHHIPDVHYQWLSLQDDGGFARMCERLRRDGVTGQRFDVRWERVAPRQGITDEPYLARARRIADIGKQAGLAYTIVLSSAPSWALSCARTDLEAFSRAYASYVDTAFSALAINGGAAPAEIQIFNELNIKNHTPPELLSHLENCTGLARKQTQGHFGNRIPLVATLHVSSPAERPLPGLKDGPLAFIKRHGDLLALLFDRIKLNYYPGIWHLPPETIQEYLHLVEYNLKALRYRQAEDKLAVLTHRTAPLRHAFANMDLLEKTIQALQPYQQQGVKLGIGEIGVPSIVPFETAPFKEEHQKLQTLGIGIVLWRLRSLFEKYRLTDVGLYSLIDEPVPEVGAFNWGLFDRDGKPKHVVGKLAELFGRINPRPQPAKS